MLTRITDRKIPCVYIHVYQIIKNWGPGPYNSLRHADNRKYFSGLSHAKSKGSAYVLLGEGTGKIWTCSCWENGNFITINEFKYGQTWIIWLSPFSYHFTVPLNQKWMRHHVIYVIWNISPPPQLGYSLPVYWVLRIDTLLYRTCKIPCKEKSLLQIQVTLSQRNDFQQVNV